MLRIFNTGKLLVKNIFVVKKRFSILTTRTDNGDGTYTITETNSLTGDSVARTYNSENNLVMTVETVHNGDGTMTKTTTYPNGTVETNTYT
tara:strand:+ start:2456 stop:2728 length:273 start_codon:yes stop_codon:yes gene_type:complete